jgi:transcriptional regulator with XRE-family HTH domain
MVLPMRLERIKLGMSQIDLWMETGIPQWRISLIERGVPPKPDERRKLAKALGIPESTVGLPGVDKEAFGSGG